MTKEGRNPKHEPSNVGEKTAHAVSSLAFRASSSFRHSSFVIRHFTLALLFASVLALDGADESTDRNTATGTWKWTFTMPDGSKIEPRAKLKEEGVTLTGTSRFREGADAPISNGRIDGTTISFAVVRERQGKKITTLYKGTRTGDRISGTIESDWTGEKQTFPWEARRFSKDPTGTWEWTQRTRSRGSDLKFILTLNHEEEKLFGKLKSSRAELEIEDGTVKDGDISFTVVRETEDATLTSKYKGKVAGEYIRGKVDTTGGDRDRTATWEAKRID